MRHDKSWSFDQIVKLKPQPHRAREVRIGSRDFSIVDSEDQDNIRFRKCGEGLEIRIYSRKPAGGTQEIKYETCDKGHKHPVLEPRQFCWMSMKLPLDTVEQLRQYLNDGFSKWRK